MPVSTFWSFWHNFLKKKKELPSYLSEYLFTIEVFAPLSLSPTPFLQHTTLVVPRARLLTCDPWLVMQSLEPGTNQHNRCYTTLPLWEGQLGFYSPPLFCTPMYTTLSSYLCMYNCVYFIQLL